MTSSGLRVAVVGATGAVGRELLTILEERRFPAASVRAFASERSAGEFVSFGGEDIAVEALDALKPQRVLILRSSQPGPS